MVVKPLPMVEALRAPSDLEFLVPILLLGFFVHYWEEWSMKRSV